MTTNTLVEILVGIALLCWIAYRQLSWTAVAPERMWRMPALLAIIGVASLVNDGASRISARDVGVLAIETVISIGLGAVMGLLAHFRPISGPTLAAFHARSRGRTMIEPTLENRTGWLGMALWLVLIATRLGGEFYAHLTGSVLLTSVGVILLTVALNRAVRIVVIIQRAQRISTGVVDRSATAA